MDEKRGPILPQSRQAGCEATGKNRFWRRQLASHGGPDRQNKESASWRSLVRHPDGAGDQCRVGGLLGESGRLPNSSNAIMTPQAHVLVEHQEGRPRSRHPPDRTPPRLGDAGDVPGSSPATPRRPWRVPAAPRQSRPGRPGTSPPASRCARRAAPHPWQQQLDPFLGHQALDHLVIELGHHLAHRCRQPGNRR